jgi:hypothetical protein
VYDEDYNVEHEEECQMEMYEKMDIPELMTELSKISTEDGKKILSVLVGKISNSVRSMQKILEANENNN